MFFRRTCPLCICQRTAELVGLFSQQMTICSHWADMDGVKESEDAVANIHLWNEWGTSDRPASSSVRLRDVSLWTHAALKDVNSYHLSPPATPHTKEQIPVMQLSSLYPFPSISSTLLRLFWETQQSFLQWCTWMGMCSPGQAGLPVQSEWTAGTVSCKSSSKITKKKQNCRKILQSV